MKMLVTNGIAHKMGFFLHLALHVFHHFVTLLSIPFFLLGVLEPKIIDYFQMFPLTIFKWDSFVFEMVSVVDLKLLNLGFNRVAVLSNFYLIRSFVDHLWCESAWSNA
jgi:hypothetical protein